jgi:hypothetical protein
MNDNNLRVLQRFSGHDATLVRHMAENPEFYTLCQDYEDCVNAWRYWTASRAPEAKARVEEYHALVRELEEEIAQVLKSFKPHS